VAATDQIGVRLLDKGEAMKNAVKMLSLVALAVVASVTGLGVNVFGVNICGTSSNKIATLDRIMVNSDTNSLVVAAKPTSSVRADFTYQVDLYERGSRRASGTVVWSQIEANAQQAQTVSFPISSQEAEAYIMLTQGQLRETFSIKVHE
jgi:hypothetical protein